MGLQVGFGQGWLFWLLYWIPVILIGTSPSVAGRRKLIWMGLALILSWFTYVVFFATETKDDSSH